MNAFLESLRVYRDPRMLAILGMGFASGLPLALTGATLAVWMRQEGVSLTAIGLFALVGLSYNFKFLWAPVIDRATLPWLGARLGRRRSWTLAIQAALVLAILALGATDPAANPLPTAAAAVVVAFLSASQDIVIDAYRVELLEDREQGAGAAAVYRLGVMRALLVCGILQMLSNLMFAVQAVVGHSVPMLMVTIGVENLTGGMGSAAFVAYLSGLCNLNYTATQYALLTSLAAMARTTLSAGGGALAQAIGWVPFFVLSTAAALPGLLLLIWLMRRLPQPSPAAKPAGALAE